MEWWDRMVAPLRRVWIGVATRISIRKTGVRRLRQEVKTCEYEDVRVMWEMLRRTDTEIARYPPVTAPQRRQKQVRVALIDWARRGGAFCRTF